MPLFLLPSTTGINRREFLSGVAGASAALALHQPSTASTRQGRAWYALISDTHIAADPKAQVRGHCMAENLRAVIDDILGQSKTPVGAIVDGDLALSDGQQGDYRAFLELLEPLRKARVPLYLALGNHDDRAHFRDILGVMPPDDTDVVDKHVGVLEGPSLRFVILDSLNGVNVTPGLLGDRQRNWLARVLDADKTTPTLIFVHHNLSSTEPNALTDTEGLLATIKPRKHVKAVVFGHTHTWTRSDDEGLHLINLPAVAYPFQAEQPLGWCRLTPSADGAELELRCIGKVKKDDRRAIPLRWRST